MSASSMSTGILVTWNTIDCIERNGDITGYSVKFQEESGAGENFTASQSFTASGLTPNTSYTFRVAGVNANGTGPYTELIIINTEPIPITTTVESVTTITTRNTNTNGGSPTGGSNIVNNGTSCQENPPSELL